MLHITAGFKKWLSTWAIQSVYGHETFSESVQVMAVGEKDPGGGFNHDNKIFIWSIQVIIHVINYL